MKAKSKSTARFFSVTVSASELGETHQVTDINADDGATTFAKSPTWRPFRSTRTVINQLFVVGQRKPSAPTPPSHFARLAAFYEANLVLACFFFLALQCPIIAPLTWLPHP